VTSSSAGRRFTFNHGLIIINNGRFIGIACFDYFMRYSLNSLNCLRCPVDNLCFRCGLCSFWSWFFGGNFPCYWLIAGRLRGTFSRDLFGNRRSFNWFGFGRLLKYLLWCRYLFLSRSFFRRSFFCRRLLSWGLRLRFGSLRFLCNNVFGRYILWRFRGRWSFFYWFGGWRLFSSGFRG
jgi:hypothetical protein